MLYTTFSGMNNNKIIRERERERERESLRSEFHVVNVRTVST
jgi:hypothetical protein